MAKSKEKLSLFWLARHSPYPMVILSGLMLALSFPPSPLAFLAWFAWIPLLLVIDQTPEKTYEDKLWGVFKGVLVTVWRGISWPVNRLIACVLKKRGISYTIPPIVYKRKIISHQAQVFRYAYTTFVIWNLGTCYWLMMTAFGAEDVSETIANFSAGLVANLVNPFLMTIPIYFYTWLRRGGLRDWAPVGFVVFWVAFEWAHLNWELSWPWLTLGYAMSTYPMVIQYAELTGVLGISMHILLVNVGLFYLIHIRKYPRHIQKRAVLFTIAVIMLPLMLNLWLIRPGRAIFQSHDQMTVRMIQPNVDPHVKSRQYTYIKQIAWIDSLISRPGLDTVDLVMLPETAIPKPHFRECLANSPLIQPLWRHVKEDSICLVAGLTEVQYYPAETPDIPASAMPYFQNYDRILGACRPYGKGWFDRFNAMVLLSPDTVPQTIRKKNLVPLVEKSFLESHLETFKGLHLSLAGSEGGYGTPDSNSNLVLPNGQKMAGLICYDAEYGNYTRKFVKDGAQFIGIITNDGWWQRSSGHIQHACYARIRAIETRRAIVRTANTGISLILDNLGQEWMATTYNSVACLDATVPLYHLQTFYVRFGDYIGYICGGLSLLLLSLHLLFRRK